MRKEEEENKETNTNNNSNIYKNEELVFNCIKRTKEEGIVELLQHLNNIPIEHLTSPSFINKLEHALKLQTIPLRNIIRHNYPSNSLIFLDYLKDKGIHIKQLICSPQIYISVLNSSLILYGKVKENVMLKNKIEERAQLELVKILIELSFDIDGFEEKMMNDALESRNLKIIKYFVSLNIFDIKIFSQNYKGRNALHVALQPIWCKGICCNFKYSIDKEQQKSLLKLIKYLVDKGVDIHQRDDDGATLLHLAAKYHSLKMIKYLVSLGIDIHSLDNKKNTIILSTFSRNSITQFSPLDLKFWNKLLQVVKYFISIGVNADNHNIYGMNAIIYTMDYNNFELIKIIGSSMPLLKSTDQKNIKLEVIQRSVNYLLKTFNIEMIKYLDEFPCFANYFDGENKIKSKNSILSYLISHFKHDQKVTFSQFKEVFEFFLNKRNNINSIDLDNRIPIQHNYQLIQYYYDKVYNNGCASWKYWNYFIKKGINLNHISNHGSILHYILDEREIKNQDYAKYIMIRSMEINSQIVDHPKFDDLKDEDSFEDFFRKDEEEENEEKVIKWKRGMAEILMKSLKILTGSKFIFDEKSLLIKINI